METEIINKAYFDNMYALANDPWNFETSVYEQEKYAHTIAALGNRHFERGLEIGCSIGVLTVLLAKHCDTVLGVDLSEQPIAQAREHYQGQDEMRFEVLQIPEQFPDGLYDLIVLSEVGYYLSKEDLMLSKELVLDALTTGGSLCLVHWRPQIEGCVFNGDEVNDYFLEGGAYTQTYQYINEKYRIDVIVKS